MILFSKPYLNLTVFLKYYRSEDVNLYELVVPKDSDWDIMNILGHLDCLHFIDLNKGEQPHHLLYTN